MFFNGQLYQTYTDKKGFGNYMSQLKFAIHCASTACGISIYLHATVKNVIYFIKWINCECTYIGKTNNFRKSVNNDISDSCHGNTIDRHIFKWLVDDKIESLFTVYGLETLNDPYERLDTMNI